MTDPEELEWLRRLRDLGQRLARERDPAALVPAILDGAIELARAERGYLVRVPPTAPGKRPRVRIEVARGFDRAALEGGGGRVSRRVVARVLEERRGVVTDGQDADLRAATTLLERGTAAALCVPLLVGDEVRAVLYLDHRADPHAFGARALAIVGAFADQAALALDAAEARAARRAPDPPAVVVPPPGPAPAASRSGALVGRSPAARALADEVERAARAPGPVLVLGEPGCEVEAVARELHARGPAAGEPLVLVRASLLAPDELEAELVGRRRAPGAADRRGALVRAGRGTLLLDEVGALPPAAQAHLLRALQDGLVRPAGGDADRPVACRVVATSTTDPAALRPDLLARLARLRVPPLRERLEDVPLLLTDWLARLRPLGQALSPEAAQAAAGYPWPENARELEAEARRLSALGELVLEPRHLSPHVRGGRGLVAGAAAGKTLADVERAVVEQALRESQGNKARAARQLGLPKTTLYHLLDRYGLR